MYRSLFHQTVATHT